MPPNRMRSYTDAIREGLDQAMARDPRVLIIGEGVPDPKGIFGTTLGLRKKYGVQRVLDMPLSENAITGMCIGVATFGLKPIMTHQRLDFALLSLDQLINNAAKWYTMFGRQQSVPIVIRMVIGRGWGQGAQHSQNLHALFAHIPGLKVVMPTTPADAKGLLLAAIADPNPVIFIEHRWLHGIKGHVPKEPIPIPLGKARVVRRGNDITMVTASSMTVEVLRAATFLSQNKVSTEVVDIRTIKPLDTQTIRRSVAKTGRLLVVDPGYRFSGVAAEIIADAVENLFDELEAPPQRITLPDLPTPSSPGLTKYYYPTPATIVATAARMLRQTLPRPRTDPKKPLDVPDPSFTGPF